MPYNIINVGVEYNEISYNSYLIIGEKNILIDTVPGICANQLIENINKYTDVKCLDALVVNHTEEDRAGAVSALLQTNSEIEVIASLAGLKNLEQQLNFSFKQTLAKSNMLYSPGTDLTLKFVITHNINWPDSMMTYLVEDKILFSCDAFSSEKSDEKEYFINKLYPMSEYVQSAMLQLKDLDIHKIYTGSGNKILTKSIIDNYLLWCDEKDKSKQITIIYKSNSGNNRYLAQYCQEKISGYQTELVDVDNYKTYENIYNSKGVIFVTPTEYRNIPKQISDIITGINHHKVSDIVFCAIGSYGWSGEAPNLIYSMLKARHFNTFKSPFRVMFKPTDADLKSIDEYLEEFIKYIN